MESNTSLAVGGRAVMRVGRNLVEVRIVEKIEGGWNVVSRTGKTVAARELTVEERETSPGAHLAVMSFFQRTRVQAATEAPAAPIADATSEPATATVPPAAETATTEAETNASPMSVSLPPQSEAEPAAETATEPQPASDESAILPSERAVPKKGLSLLSAAAAVLETSAEPLAVKAIIEKAKAANLWSPTNGKTPEQTLYSAIIREIKDKGDRSRFRKEDRGRFAFAR